MMSTTVTTGYIKALMDLLAIMGLQKLIWVHVGAGASMSSKPIRHIPPISTKFINVPLFSQNLNIP